MGFCLFSCTFRYRVRPEPTCGTEPTPTPEDETVRIPTEEIKLNVLAFDEEGKFVRDVRDNDLVITDNNILHQPSSVRRIPANVLIVMDTGGELRAVKSLDQTKRRARAVVEALRPGDHVAVMQYGDTASIVGEWTGDKHQAIAAINRTKFGRRDAFVDALNLARSFLMKSGLENKHLVLITDGTDSTSNPSAKHDALRDMFATDISVHVLSYTRMEAEDGPAADENDQQNAAAQSDARRGRSPASQWSPRRRHRPENRPDDQPGPHASEEIKGPKG